MSTRRRSALRGFALFSSITLVTVFILLAGAAALLPSSKSGRVLRVNEDWVESKTTHLPGSKSAPVFQDDVIYGEGKVDFAQTQPASQP